VSDGGGGWRRPSSAEARPSRRALRWPVPCPLGPDILGRIEFRRVGREVMSMETRVLPEERLDLSAPVDRAVVPEQVDGAAQVAQQMV
jgi:hypothetical protein